MAEALKVLSGETLFSSPTNIPMKIKDMPPIMREVVSLHQGFFKALETPVNTSVITAIIANNKNNALMVSPYEWVNKELLELLRDTLMRPILALKP